MKRTIALLAAGLAGAVIALLSLGLVTGAFAQGPPAPGAYGGQMMGRGQMGGGEQSLVGMAAAEAGITRQELVAQLGTGGTIADALRAAGKDPDGLVEAFVASRAERLNAAVAAGTLSREDADARLATARSTAADRIGQPFTALGPGGQGLGCQDADGTCGRTGAGFVDENGDGICDLMPEGGQMRGPMGGRGPRR